MSTPHVKFESSPVESLADSFVSTPGTQYPPLFGSMDSEAMTPQSYDDDDDDSMFGSLTGTPAPEKKPVKKRKSWGQQLPEPKTNLPPRKRAKTEDEKEQRRVERVLRNRRAAQSSRERKRQEVEALELKMMEKERLNQDVERRNRDLEMQLADMQAKYLAVQQQLELATGGNMTVFRGSVASSPAHTEQFRAAPSPVTFSQELFGSRDAPERSSFSAQHTIESQAPQTVNPASLSPEMRPVAESNASSSDMTQHPAAMLWSQADLQSPGFHDPNQYNFGSYFDAPDPTGADFQFFENGVLPVADAFDLNYDHMAHHHDSILDDFNINEFLHDENNQPAPEAQSSDKIVESTASLQPQLGASFNGCDDGGNAVSV